MGMYCIVKTMVRPISVVKNSRYLSFDLQLYYPKISPQTPRHLDQLLAMCSISCIMLVPSRSNITTKNSAMFTHPTEPITTALVRVSTADVIFRRYDDRDVLFNARPSVYDVVPYFTTDVSVINVLLCSENTNIKR